MLKTQPHVVAAAPGLYGQVLVSRGPRSGGALIKGILPADEAAVSDLLQAVREGTAAPLSQTSAPGALPPLVLGSDLAQTLGAKPGDAVLVTSPQGELTPFGLQPRFVRYQLAGIFHSGFFQYDSSYAFTRLADAQRLFSEPDLISVLSFKVDDLYNAPAIAKQLEAAAGPRLPDHQLDGAKQGAVSRSAPGTGGYVHRHRAHRLRGPRSTSSSRSPCSSWRKPATSPYL